MPSSHLAGASRKVAIVGAGNISQIHVEALQHLGAASVAAVVDADITRAEAQARKWGAPHAFADIQSLIEAKVCDTAHVLVPPNLHRAVAEPLLRAGIDVLLEKPMAASSAECDALLAAAAEGGAKLGVNHNFQFLPSYLALKRDIETYALGRLRHVICHFNMPVRQIGAGQFSHWMFRLPQNILLEQAVHPLGMVLDLTGPVRDLHALPGPVQHIAPGTDFYRTWQVTMTGERADAQVLISVGEDMPAWGLLAICDDGVVHLDILADRRTVQRKTKWPAFFDEFLNEGAATGVMGTRAVVKAVSYLLSLLKLRPRSDQFFRTMSGSIGAFHAGLAQGRLPVDGGFGAEVVALCERIAGPLAIDPAAAASQAPATASGATGDTPTDDTPAEVVVLGGTGFIGRHVLTRLLQDGHRVAVMARNTRMLPAIFQDPRVRVVAGDIGNAEDVGKIVAGSRYVINLAHGGGGNSWAEVQQRMVGGAKMVAEACLRHQVSRLVFVSSIAALYLGDPAETITGATPPDPKAETRADYARAKAESERALLDMARDRALPLCILRPGVVVGEGGIPFHTGTGFFNVDRHCLGWNEGNNPLPFVLVEDVADAVVRAMTVEAATGRAFNLVGDIRLTARDYVAELGRALKRPLVFHPQSVYKLQMVEMGKWLVKRVIGRQVPPPDLRDLKSRGMTARFDCSDAKEVLDWRPVSDRAAFVRRGIAVYDQG